MPNSAQIGVLSGVFDPAQLAVTILSGGVTSIISGFGENVITCERNSNQADSYAGADGGVVKYYTNDRRGKIQVELLPTSPSNAIFAGLARNDESVGDTNFSFLAKDNLGNDVISSDAAWIMKQPRTIYKKGVEVRVWEIECANLDMKVLGQGILK